MNQKLTDSHEASGISQSEAERKLGSDLQRFRKMKGWTQERMAKILGVTQQAVSNMEKNGDISAVHLYRLRAFGLDVDSFLDEFATFGEESDPFLDTLELFKILYRGGFEEVYSKRGTALEKFVKYIQRESEKICITGSSLRGLTVNREIWNSIVDQVKKSDLIEFHLILTHPALSPLRAFVEGREATNIDGEIKEALDTYFSNIKKIGGDRVEARIALHPPTVFAIFLIGQGKALINPYTMTREAFSTSTFIVRDTGNEDCMFQQYLKQHFEEAWELTKHPGRVSIPLDQFDAHQESLQQAMVNVGDILKKIANGASNDVEPA